MIINHDKPQTVADALYRIQELLIDIERLVAGERERCAKIVEAYEMSYSDHKQAHYHCDWVDRAKTQIAAAIRGQS